MRLRQGSHYLKTALDQVSEGVLILMPEQDGREAYVMHGNARAHLLAGVDPTEGLRERSLSELAADPAAADTLRAALKRAQSGGGGTTCVCDLRTGFGERRLTVQWQVRAVTNDHGVLMNHTLTFSPVEQRESASAAVAGETDLDEASRRLRTETMATLAEGIAHDVNNLLGPMLSRLSLLLQQTREDAALSQELELMFASVKRARQFTQQVVKSARARCTERSPVDLARLARETVTLCSAGSNVQAHVSESSDLMWAYGDSVRITQVLQNLVMNGMQAMPGGGLLFVELGNAELEPVNPVGLPAGRYVEVRVRDRGVGMSPETVARLFKDSFTTKADGNGIGLTTCHRFVVEQGGAILVTSQPNVGSEFRVLLPAVAPCAAELGSASEAPIPLQAGEGRVLVVEDEEPLRHVARCILTKCGYEPSEATHGEEAIRLYREAMLRGEKPDVVLMDLTLPGGLSGAETAKAILRLDPEARLVVTSGSVTEDIQRLFLDEGFVAVLPKPYEAGALSRTVKDVISRSQAEVGQRSAI